MELVSVAEASQRLGLTQDTVKRRLRKGELQGERHPRPQGYVWLVELAEEAIDDDSTTSTQGDDRVRQGVSNGEVRRLEEMVVMLQGQVAAQQEQLESRVLAAPPDRTRPRPRPRAGDRLRRRLGEVHGPERQPG